MTLGRHEIRAFEERKNSLLDTLRESGITDERVLRAIASVPREHFVPRGFQSQAYSNSALPIACQQTISQPYTVAFMTSLLNVQPGDKILEIGTGSGYQAAVLAALGARVFTIERHAELHFATRKLLDSLGLSIATRLGDGTIGWSEFAPYNGIIVTAGSPDVPPTLTRQLALGGRLVIPVGDRETQTLYVITRTGDEQFDVAEFHDFRFVPLIGREGWQSS